MKFSFSIVWLLFAFLFLGLCCYHYNASKRDIPPFKLSERPLGKKVAIKAAGADLDQLTKDFAKNFNAYLDRQNKFSRKQNKRSAYGYFIAFLAAIVSMLAEWRQEIRVFVKKRTI